MLIITANQHQALQLKHNHVYRQAKIITWQKALHQLGAALPYTVLHPIAARLIFQQCVTEINADTQSSIESLAVSAEEAWRLMKQWSISWQELAQSVQANTQWFYRVAKKFSAYLAAHHCVDEAEWSMLIIEWVHEHPSQAITCLTGNQYDTILFYGFLQRTPLQQKLIYALRSVVTVTELLALEISQSETTQLHIFDERAEELAAAVHWVVACYAEDPRQKIALIVPELNAYRDSLVRKMRYTNCQEDVWKIITPPALTTYGMIQTALTMLLLHAEVRAVEVNLMLSFLRSPYWGQMPEQRVARGILAGQLQALQCARLDWEALLIEASNTHELQQQLGALRGSFAHKKQSLCAWVADWKDLFHLLEFPNHGLLTAQEVALQERFFLLLDECATLFSSEEHYSYLQAYHCLRSLCANTYWDGMHDSACHSVVIVDVLDAMSMKFDRAWLLNATQGVVPFTLRANELLDKKIQRRHGMWSVDFTIQDSLASQCYEQLKKCTKNLVVSYAKQCEGEMKNPALFCATLMASDYAAPQASNIMPVPIVGAIPITLEDAMSNTDKLSCMPSPRGAATAACTPLPHARARGGGDRTVKCDEYSSSLKSWPEHYLPGGSGALKSQRLCSMQAFAKHRLNLKKLPEPTIGLSPIERGIVVHRALQLIWQQLHSQEQLLALSEDALAALLADIVPIALMVIKRTRYRLLPKSLFRLEQDYLVQLLRDWLAHEATRPPFTIFALEQETELTFGGYQWRLRVDRIDQLSDGRLLLIDYKTGSSSINTWQLDVFTEPQLPLYLVSHALNIDAICFAELSSKRLAMVGLGNTSVALGSFGRLKGVDDWTALTADWQSALQELVKGFVQTTAELNPVAADTCARCGLQSFCRIDLLA